MKLKVHHWRFGDPPCKNTFEVEGEDGRFIDVVYVDELLNMLDKHDLMLRKHRDGKIVMYIDDRGKRFKQM